MNAPSSNILAKDSATGSFNGHLIHGTTSATVETPDTPESEEMLLRLMMFLWNRGYKINHQTEHR